MSNDDSEPTEVTSPEVVSPVSPTALALMKETMPTGQSGGQGIELEGVTKTMPELLGAILAFWEKEMYSVIERSSLTPREIPIFTGLIHTATHGIGGDLLDIPEPEVGQRVVYELRARRSLVGVELGASSQSFEHIMTNWLKVLKAEEERKIREGSPMVGMK